MIVFLHVESFPTKVTKPLSGDLRSLPFFTIYSRLECGYESGKLYSSDKIGKDSIISVFKLRASSNGFNILANRGSDGFFGDATLSNSLDVSLLKKSSQFVLPSPSLDGVAPENEISEELTFTLSIYCIGSTNLPSFLSVKCKCRPSLLPLPGSFAPPPLTPMISPFLTFCPGLTMIFCM